MQVICNKCQQEFDDGYDYDRHDQEEYESRPFWEHESYCSKKCYIESDDFKFYFDLFKGFYIKLKNWEFFKEYLVIYNLIMNNAYKFQFYIDMFEKEIGK